ncbi:sugar transferase [Fundidesulfovibrio terrae]|uniref:sugar transferase n=1 Tax=Fundidesulfovibrio terrae TaxID=2922866 RepID=UPI001FAF08A5|nr:sugar transferase [Fundidesulfovibrio terrae]
MHIPSLWERFKVYRTWDLAAVCLAMMASFWLAGSIHLIDRPDTIRAALDYRVRVGSVILVAGSLVMWRVLFWGFGLYDPWRRGKWRIKAQRLVGACLTGVVIMGCMGVVTGRPVDPGYLLVLWPATFFLVAAERFLISRIMSRDWRFGSFTPQVILVGSGPRMAEFLAEHREKRETGQIDVLGFVDDDWAGSSALQELGIRRLGAIASLPKLLDGRVVDSLVVGLPVRKFYEETEWIIDLAATRGVDIKLMLATDRLRSKRFWLEGEGAQLLSLGLAGMSGFEGFLKRLLDVCGALAAMLVLSPLFFAAALSVKLSTPGPVIFSQWRAGLGMRPFRMLKFRSMVADAEARLKDVAALNYETGPAFKIKDDPRVTRVGAFLRKYSIDELPQFFNVLRGEMSLVGPRPLFAYEIERIDDPSVKRRFSVKPGITGLWQIGDRGRVTFDERLRQDLDYIDNWSIWLDIKILLKTPFAVFRAKTS